MVRRLLVHLLQKLLLMGMASVAILRAHILVPWLDIDISLALVHLVWEGHGCGGSALGAFFAGVGGLVNLDSAELGWDFTHLEALVLESCAALRVAHALILVRHRALVHKVVVRLAVDIVAVVR